jgi:hypothetical protein
MRARPPSTPFPVAQTKGRILVSDRAHLLFDLHKEVDGAREAELAVRFRKRPRSSETHARSASRSPRALLACMRCHLR